MELFGFNKVPFAVFILLNQFKLLLLFFIYLFAGETDLLLL